MKTIIDRVIQGSAGYVKKHYLCKKMLFWMLKTPIFTKNPVYIKLYNKRIKKRVKQFEKSISTIQIENTSYCNISCVFCPNETMSRKKGFTDQALFQDIIKQCVRNRINTVIISGFGEPLLDKHYIEEVKYAKESGINSVGCVTNGILLTKEISKGLIEAKLDSIFVSIDAASAKVYGEIHRNVGSNTPYDKYDLVVANIKHLSNLKKQDGRRNPEIQVRFKDFEMNRRELKKFVKTFSKLADEINVYMSIFRWPGSEIKSNISKRWPILKFPCHTLWTGLYICYDGRVALCCQDYECKIELGDLRKDSIMKIWRGEKLNKIRRLHMEGRYNEIPLCSDCTINTHYVMPWWP